MSRPIIVIPPVGQVPPSTTPVIRPARVEFPLSITSPITVTPPIKIPTVELKPTIQIRQPISLAPQEEVPSVTVTPQAQLVELVELSNVPAQPATQPIVIQPPGSLTQPLSQADVSGQVQTSSRGLILRTTRKLILGGTTGQPSRLVEAAEPVPTGPPPFGTRDVEVIPELPNGLNSRPFDFIISETSQPSQPKSTSPVVRFQTKPNPKISLLHRVVINILNILERRGYIIPESLQKIKEVSAWAFFISYQRMKEQYNIDSINQALDGLFHHREKDESIYVHYPRTPEVGKSTKKSQIDHFLNLLGETLNTNRPILRAMIVSEYPLFSRVQHASENNYPSIKLEFFTYDKASYSATENFLTPIHELMTEDEVREFLTDNGAAISSLKTIAYDDPVVRENAYEIGDIIRIIRKNIIYNSIIPVTVEYRRVNHRPMVAKKK